MKLNSSLTFLASSLLCTSFVGAQQEKPAAPQEEAALEIDLGAVELRANSDEVDALLAKVEAAHRGILSYSYSSQVGVQVMMGGPGGGADPMEASFTRKGTVIQGGPLGTLIECKKSLELPGLTDGLGGGMDEQYKVLERSADLLIDFGASEMAAMTGGPQGLTKIKKSEIEELRQMMPMPAPMDFVMLHTPGYANPRDFVRAITDQTALTQIESTQAGVVISGKAGPGLIPPADPSADLPGDVEVRLTVHAETHQLLRVEIGPSEKPRMSANFSDYAKPEKLAADRFNLNPEGKEVKDLAPLLRAQFEQMASFGGGSESAVDEDEF